MTNGSFITFVTLLVIGSCCSVIPVLSSLSPIQHSTIARRNFRHVPRQICSTSKDCTRGQYCLSSSCHTKLSTNATCTPSHSRLCISGSCDAIKRTCQSVNLSHLTRCHASSSCASGNCQDGYCRKQLGVDARCKKDSNCQSGSCSKKTLKCFQPLGSNLLPYVPWDRDLTDLSNLKPSKVVKLHYAQSGRYDPSTANFLAEANITPNYYAVTLSHSSWVGHVQCQNDNQTIVVPMLSELSYAYAKKHWTEHRKQFLLVTHSIGCTTAVNPDQRTFWRVDGLKFDDKHYIIDVAANQLAVEEAFNQVNLTYGQYQATSNSDVSQSTNSSTKLPIPADNTTNFDQALDQALGFYDFTHDAATALPQFVPGIVLHSLNKRFLGSFANDVVEAADDVGNAFVQFGDDVAYAFTYAWNAIESTASYVYTEASQQAEAAAIDLSQAVTSSLKTIAYDAKTQVFQILNIVEGAASVFVSVVKQVPVLLNELVHNSFDPSLSASTSYSWSPDADDTNVDQRPSAWGTNLHSLLSYSQGAALASLGSFEDLHSAYLLKGQQLVSSHLPDGTLQLDCVNCGVQGSLSFQGQLNFQIVPPAILDCYMDVGGSFKAGLNLGLLAQTNVSGSKEKELASYPLPGGFSIIDIVDFGPSISVGADMNVDLNMKADILVGMDLEIPEFDIHVDLVISDNTYANFPEPSVNFSHSFVGMGSVKATAGLPFAIGVGLEIPKLHFSKTATLIFEPALVTIAATGALESDFTLLGLPNCPLGMAYTVGTSATLSTNIFDAYQYQIASVKGPTLAAGCYPLMSSSDQSAFVAQYASIAASQNVPVPSGEQIINTPVIGSSFTNFTVTSVPQAILPRQINFPFTFFSLSYSNVSQPMLHIGDPAYFNITTRVAARNHASVSLRNSTDYADYASWTLNSDMNVDDTGFLSNNDGSVLVTYDTVTGQLLGPAMKVTFDAQSRPHYVEDYMPDGDIHDLLLCYQDYNVDFTLEAVRFSCRGYMNPQINTFFRCGPYTELYFTDGRNPGGCTLIDDMSWQPYLQDD